MKYPDKKGWGIVDMIDDLRTEREEARSLACRLTEEVVELRANASRPTDDGVRLEQVAAILDRYLGAYLADEIPPASLLRALAIAQREV